MLACGLILCKFGFRIASFFAGSNIVTGECSLTCLFGEVRHDKFSNVAKHIALVIGWRQERKFG